MRYDARARGRTETTDRAPGTSDMRILLVLLLVGWSATAQELIAPIPASPQAGEVFVGCATVDITPDGPAALAGQFNLRISKKVETPLVASAVAIETRDGDRVIDQAILISVDLVGIRDGVQERFRKVAGPRLKGFDVRKAVLSATHTHTAPLTTTDAPRYDVPKQGVVQPPDYVEFLVNRLADAAVKAWESRAPGMVSWTLGHAVVGHNRRPVYANGAARMYGPSSTPDFRGLEGFEDHSLHALYFWDRDRKLRAVAINLACPAQDVESRSTINADYWHEVRTRLRKELGDELCVVGWIAAAGDQSPRPMIGKKAEDRMRTLRGLTSTQEIGRRISGSVLETLEIARKDARDRVPMTHRVADLALTRRVISETEYKAAGAALAKFKAKGQLVGTDRVHMLREQDVVERYEKSAELGKFPVEVHALRIGDVAIATNPFELFLDYGLQIQGRSPATQTFVIQLACNYSGYLPTAQAIRHGSYSATPPSNQVGPEGGQELVDQTVGMLEELWSAPRTK